MGALRSSRNPTDAISTYNAWGKFSSADVRHSLPDACGIALRKTVERMQGMDMSQRDLMSSMSGGGASSILEVGLKGLQTLRDQLQIWPDLDDAGERAQYVDNAIIKFGTGGGFFRDHFAAFMHWSSRQRPDLVTSSTVRLAQESADRWNQLSPTLQHLVANSTDLQSWKSAGTQVEDIYEVEYSLFGHLADKVLRAG